VALNIPDFTRYAKSQPRPDGWAGVGLPRDDAVRVIGVAVTSESAVIFGEAIVDPVSAAAENSSADRRADSVCSLLLANLKHQVAANVVSPSNYLYNLSPSLISFPNGGDHAWSAYC